VIRPCHTTPPNTPSSFILKGSQTMGIPVEDPSHRINTSIDSSSSSSLRLPCPNDSQQPLTAFVRHHVLRNKHTEFEKWCIEINALAQKYEGFISTEVIKPVCHDSDDPNEYNIHRCNPNRGSDEFISIVRFQNYVLLKKWMNSDERKRMLQRTDEFSMEKSLHSYHSLEHWFPSSSTNDSIDGTNPTKKGGPPPKWKMCIFVTIIIFTQLTWIKKVTNHIFPNIKNQYCASLLNTTLVVIFVTYIAFPICTRLVAFWLFPHENYKDKLRELIPKFISSRLTK
jgi:uncharacterized protein